LSEAIPKPASTKPFRTLQSTIDLQPKEVTVKRKRIIVVAVIVLLLAGTALKFRKSAAQPKQPIQQAQAIPDFEIYRQMFHHHVTMKQKADDLEKQGKDGKSFREFYKRQARLTDDEARTFDEIATDCEKQVAAQDAKAKAIRDAALAANGNGKLEKGSRPPDPAPELRTLWNERNAIITRAQYALQAAFGDSEFARFENYVKQDVVPHLSLVPPSHPRPSPIRQPRGPKISRYPAPEEEVKQ
jgi:hypothetical protein